MPSQSEQFEQEAEETRWKLTGTLEELRTRMTPGEIVGQAIGYARNGPAAVFFRNLGREVRENPMPIVLIGIGIAWLMVASSRSARVAIANAADTVADKATDISTATSATVTRASQWGQQTIAKASERADDAVRTVSDRTAEIAGRAREISGGVAEGARRISAVAGATVKKAKRPFSSDFDRDGRAVEGALEAMHREREEACTVEAAAHERR